MDSQPTPILAYSKSSRLQLDTWQAMASYIHVDFYATTYTVISLNLCSEVQPPKTKLLPSTFGVKNIIMVGNQKNIWSSKCDNSLWGISMDANLSLVCMGDQRESRQLRREGLGVFDFKHLIFSVMHLR